MDSSKFYIAVLGANEPDTIKKVTKPIIVLGVPFHAIEVYRTPFDAVRGLRKTVQILPEHHVTIYQSTIDCGSIITVSNKGESRSLALTDLEFEKHAVMALGSLVYSL